MTKRDLHWTVNGTEFAVRIEESRDRGTIYVDSQPTTFRILEQTPHGTVIDIDGLTQRVFVVRDRTGCTVWWNGRTFRLERSGRNDVAHLAATAGTGEIRSPMPGKVLRIEVKPGDAVDEKQPLLVLESMKMETTIASNKAGRVTEIHVEPGQVVDMAELLLTVE